MSSLPGVSSRAAYRIRIAGRVGNGWDDFLTGGKESVEMLGRDLTTVVMGTFVDQAALFGMLSRIRDRGLVLVSVEYLGPDSPVRLRSNGSPEASGGTAGEKCAPETAWEEEEQ